MVEPEWDADERGYAMALLEVEADACPGCGEPLSETTKAEAEDGYRVQAPVRCHGCRALYDQQRHYTDDPMSLHFTVQRTWKGGGDG